jgi:hypothetical protein
MLLSGCAGEAVPDKPSAVTAAMSAAGSALRSSVPGAWHCMQLSGCWRMYRVSKHCSGICVLRSRDNRQVHISPKLAVACLCHNTWAAVGVFGVWVCWEPPHYLTQQLMLAPGCHHTWQALQHVLQGWCGRCVMRLVCVPVLAMGAWCVLSAAPAPRQEVPGVPVGYAIRDFHRQVCMESHDCAVLGMQTCLAAGICSNMPSSVQLAHSWGWEVQHKCYILQGVRGVYTRVGEC